MMIPAGKIRANLLLGLCLLGIIAVWYLSRGVQSDTIVLETEHLQTLEPHEHDAGEAVEDIGHHHYLRSAIYVAPRDLWISAYEFKLFNAPDTTVHHTALLDLDERHQSCPDIPMKELNGFAQDSMFHPIISFPRGTAMHVPKGHRLEFLVMEHNPEPPVGPGGVYHDVYGTLTISLYPGATDDLKEVEYQILHLDQVPCDVKYSDGTDAFMFTVPPHSSGYRYAGTNRADDPSRYTFPKDSTVVFIGGHLHGWQGGKELFVQKDGAPFLHFTTVPAPGYPFRYDSQYYPTDLEFRAGETLSLTAVYDNPDAVPTRGAMGILEMYYYQHE